MKAIILFLLGLFSAAVFWAQAPPQQRPPAEKPIDTSTVERILAGEEEVAAGGGFSYDPAGRRDPFRSLLAGRSREEMGQRPPGLPGMGVEEIKLQGIIKLPEGFVALIQGTDNLSYIIKPGTVLYDGTVEKIEPGKVTFKVNVADPRSLKPYREVVRTLQ
ncbi:MAG: pilus assembly protein PilP [Thermoanaerobaculum sp.]|nr:pilus assembly protein PilP [Thermoanaerobaculum sp.]